MRGPTPGRRLPPSATLATQTLHLWDLSLSRRRQALSAYLFVEKTWVRQAHDLAREPLNQFWIALNRW